MEVNKAGGNMYKWITHTWNPIAGQCPHACIYCYVEDLKSKPVLAEKYSGEPRLVENEMQTNLYPGSKDASEEYEQLSIGHKEQNVIFVQNCGDLFAEGVPHDAIMQVLEHCNEYPENRYLIQTKNPIRMIEYSWDLPNNVILGTTVEGDVPPQSEAPHWINRVAGLIGTHLAYKMHRKTDDVKSEIELMISIEPITEIHRMDDFLSRILVAQPSFISVGADSKKMGLDEPEAWRIFELVGKLASFTRVILKPNLKRIIGENMWNRLLEVEKVTEL